MSQSIPSQATCTISPLKGICSSVAKKSLKIDGEIQLLHDGALRDVTEYELWLCESIVVDGVEIKNPIEGWILGKGSLRPPQVPYELFVNGARFGELGSNPNIDIVLDSDDEGGRFGEL